MQMGEGPHERYVLLRPLNSGGYGTVYEAEDRDSGERVAIKKSHLLSEAEDPNDQGVPVVVLREGAVLRRLQHPNVLRLFDIYLHLGHHNFMFELYASAYFSIRQHTTLGHGIRSVRQHTSFDLIHL